LIGCLRTHITAGRLFFAAALVHALWAMHLGWDHTLLDAHGFRQTQTALSAYYSVSKLPKLAYETPVLGPPWSIPFELPVYQWVVAGLVTALGTPMDPTGRFVSAAMFLLTLLPANAILRRLQISAEGRLLVLGLLLLSPFYLFWSRTFMIESTALFLSTSYLAAGWGSLENPRAGRVAVALGCGCLAGAVKAPTLAAFLVAMAIVGIRAEYARGRSGAPVPRRAILGTVTALLLIVPVAATLLWTHFADAQKELNPSAVHLTSTALRSWNFGTLGKRLDPDTWTSLLARTRHVVPVPVLVVGLAGTLLSRRRWQLVGVCAALFVCPPLVFTNLHTQHNYYAYANNIFLVAAVALGLVALLESGRELRRWGPFALVAVIALECYGHWNWYGLTQLRNQTGSLRISRALAAATQEDDVVLSLGMDWTSELAYYSRRRMLMKPGRAADCLQALPQLCAQLRGYRIGAVILDRSSLGPLTSDEGRQLLAPLGPAAREVYADQTVAVYVAAPDDSGP
jgi:hypothetical protein